MDRLIWLNPGVVTPARCRRHHHTLQCSPGTGPTGPRSMPANCIARLRNHSSHQPSPTRDTATHLIEDGHFWPRHDQAFAKSNTQVGWNQRVSQVQAVKFCLAAQQLASTRAHLRLTVLPQATTKTEDSVANRHLPRRFLDRWLHRHYITSKPLTSGRGRGGRCSADLPI